MQQGTVEALPAEKSSKDGNLSAIVVGSWEGVDGTVRMRVADPKESAINNMAAFAVSVSAVSAASSELE